MNFSYVIRNSWAKRLAFSTSLVICNGAWCLAGCGNSAVGPTASGYTTAVIAAHFAARVSPKLVATMATVSFQTYYEKLLATTTDAAVTVEGVTVDGVHSRLEHSAVGFVALAKAYPSVGAFLAANSDIRLSESDAAIGLPDMLKAFGGAAGLFKEVASASRVWPQTISSAKSELVFTQPSMDLRNLAAIAALALAQNYLGAQQSASLSLVGAITAIAKPSRPASAGNPAVVRLRCTNADGNMYYASGVFDRNNRLVTAGHVTRGKASISYSPPNGQEVAATGFVTNPAFTGAATRRYDVGKVTFPDGTAPAIMPIDYNYYPPGTTYGMQGYGGDEPSLACGENTITGYANGAVILQGPGSQAEPGDSGSPGIITAADGTQYANAFNSGGNGTTSSSYAPAAANKDFLSQ